MAFPIFQEPWELLSRPPLHVYSGDSLIITRTHTDIHSQTYALTDTKPFLKNVTPCLYANTISHRDLSTSACQEIAETDAYSDTDISVAAKVMLEKTKSLVQDASLSRSYRKMTGGNIIGALSPPSRNSSSQSYIHLRIHRCKSENVDMSSQSGTAMPTPVYERSDMSFFETELVIPQVSDLSSISKSAEHVRRDEQDPINLENYSGSGTASSSFFRKLTHIFGGGSYITQKHLRHPEDGTNLFRFELSYTTEFLLY